jgi:hypothetical protein
MAALLSIAVTTSCRWFKKTVKELPADHNIGCVTLFMPREALAQQDRPYLEWLSSQEWFRHRYSRCRAAPGAPVLDDSCISKIAECRL